MANEMDIMSALNSFFTGLQQNMRQSKQDQIQSLALLSKMPGAELTPATGAETVPWWQALMGVPAFRSSAGGMPVANIGGSPVTVRQYGRAENQAFLEDMLTNLGGGGTVTATPPETTTAAVGLAPAGPLTETDNLTGVTTGAPPLTAANIQARTNRFRTIATNFGVTPEKFAADYDVQRLLRTPGRQDEALGKRYREMVKEERERRLDEEKLLAAKPDTLIKSQEWVSRRLARVKDQPGLDQALAELQGVIDPGLFATLPTVYEPTTVANAVQQGLSYTQMTEAERAAAQQQAQIPGKVAEQQALLPGKLQEAMNEARIRGDQELVNYLAKAPYELQKSAAHGENASRLANKTRATLDQKRLEELDKAAGTAVKTTEALAEIEGLMARGVYGTGAEDMTIMRGYQTGLLFQGDQKAVRTARLKELGAALITAMGSLGNQVSNADREVYEKASGNFQQAKNIAEMQESIASMRRVAITALANANAARKQYDETGTLPEYALPGGAGAGTPSPASGPITNQEIDLNLVEANKLRATKGQPPVTRQDIIDGLRKLGYQVP